MKYKTTPEWAWPVSRAPISTFWDPLITFQGKELSASNLVETEHGASLRRDHKTTHKWACPYHCYYYYYYYYY